MGCCCLQAPANWVLLLWGCCCLAMTCPALLTTYKLVIDTYNKHSGVPETRYTLACRNCKGHSWTCRTFFPRSSQQKRARAGGRSLIRVEPAREPVAGEEQLHMYVAAETRIRSFERPMGTVTRTGIRLAVPYTTVYARRMDWLYEAWTPPNCVCDCVAFAQRSWRQTHL